MTDLVGLVGAVVVVIGVALWSVPLAVVVAGAMMVGLAVLVALANAKRGPDERGKH